MKKSSKRVGKKVAVVNEKFLIQQGDVLLYGGEQIPAGPQEPCQLRSGRLILADGETTGHAHAITETQDVEAFKINNEIWMKVKRDGVTVRHEEHGPVTLPKGNYRVGQVVEVDPFTDEVRAVRD